MKTRQPDKSLRSKEIRDHDQDCHGGGHGSGRRTSDIRLTTVRRGIDLFLLSRRWGPTHPHKKLDPESCKSTHCFCVGATRDDLIKAYGEPDPNPGSPWLRWRTQHHVDCILGKDDRVVEVRFSKGFNMPTTSGVRIGSAEEEALSAYGKPDRVVQQAQSRMLVFSKRGILMWIIDGKVFDFTVIKQR